MFRQKAAHGSSLAIAFLFALAALLAPVASFAATTGTVQGTITDQSGAPIPSVRLTLDIGTGSPLHAKTDSQGHFLFLGVPPGTYKLTAEVVTFTAQTLPVTVNQDNTSTVNFSLEKTVNVRTQRIIINPVHQRETQTQYSISNRVEQLTKSQPNNLYQFPGLVFGQPGVTPDPSGYTHIRGSDFNQVGFDVDGVQITEPMTNSFATNLVTVGLKSANLYTGGADASYGNSTGGFINEITENGKDIKGGVVEGTFGPGHGWDYAGTNSQYGNTDGKFDYYASTVQFSNNFPGNTQIQRLNTSNDTILKSNYYADENNQFTAFLSKGFEQYDNYEVPSPATTFKFEQGLGTSIDKTVYQQDHDDQGYDFDYATFQHKFSPQAFASYRFYRVKSFVTFHEENTFATWQERHSTQLGNQLDYTNQVSPADQLRLGLSYVPSSTFYHTLSNLDSATTLLPVSQLNTPGYVDILSQARADQTALYLSNQLQALSNKLVLTTGLRYSNMHFGLKKFSSFDDHAVDPRVGLTYSPVRDLVFRSSYAVQSQFPDSRLVERLFPEDIVNGHPIAPATATDPAAQLKFLQGRYQQYNPLGASHANNFDFGLEKGFNAFGNAMNVTLTGFSRKQYDLIQYNRIGYNPLHGRRFYTNDGTGHASGLEFKLTVPRRNLFDTNGFVSYTNQVAKATSSDFDTGYIPYFYNAFAGDPNTSDAEFRRQNHIEYPTTYDQRHTVGVVVNKQLTKVFEESVILDAGSGFPFLNGLTGVGQSADPQHSTNGVGNAGFGEVPITLFDQRTLQPLNPVAGRSGWHYKITLNTNIYVTPNTSLFFNVDNVFDKKTVLNYSTTTQAGAPYYAGPTAQYPEGRFYYGNSTIITPIFVTFGFRSKF